MELGKLTKDRIFDLRIKHGQRTDEFIIVKAWQSGIDGLAVNHSTVRSGVYAITHIESGIALIGYVRRHSIKHFLNKLSEACPEVDFTIEDAEKLGSTLSLKDFVTKWRRGEIT